MNINEGSVYVTKSYLTCDSTRTLKLQEKMTVGRDV